MIGQILAKLGRNEILNRDELQYIEIWGNATESQLSYVDGLQEGHVDVYANNIHARTGYFDTPARGLSGRFTGVSPTVATATVTMMNFTGAYKVSPRFGTVPTAAINIPFTGKWRLEAFISFETHATGYRRARFHVIDPELGGGSVADAVQVAAVTGGFTSFMYNTEASFDLFEQVQLGVYQTSGEALSCTASMRLTHLGPKDGEGWIT